MNFRLTLLLLLPAAALTAFVACSSTDSSTSACGSSDGICDDAGSDDAAVAADEGAPQGGKCASNFDCANGGVCGFPRAQACAATGTCFPIPGPDYYCKVTQPLLCGCGPDAAGVTSDCTFNLPEGYYEAPIDPTCGDDQADAGGDDVGNDLDADVDADLDAGRDTGAAPDADAH